ncbi:hypothetical protein GCM10009430_24330 [Aquimarina litoralis]|uniref:Uncharacterized protein n=1 Tax=Aquimarina litoralis TaxID=584605 RepID=A0ABN1IVH2_9FLAO
MKLFPTKKYEFKLIGTKQETLDRLTRRTEKSDYLTSQWTDKTFRGKISGDEFRIISSTIGKGAFCVLSGKIGSANGIVNVEINKVFKILLGIIYLMPIIGIIITIKLGGEKFEPLMILSIIGQILIIRFIAVWFFFIRFSKHSLNQFRDVLDIEWIKN